MRIEPMPATDDVCVALPIRAPHSLTGHICSVTLPMGVLTPSLALTPHECKTNLPIDEAVRPQRIFFPFTHRRFPFTHA